MSETQLERRSAAAEAGGGGRLFRQYADLCTLYMEEFASFYSFQWMYLENFFDMMPKLLKSEVVFYRNLADWAVKVEAISGTRALRLDGGAEGTE
ncbi:MAG: hypothetical protein KGI33_05385 [Thaumarchaeota archaeon]|nr:hypothetical protein [Nitrososphaerota archaeon]